MSDNDVAKALGSPIVGELSDYTQRVRRTLLSVSTGAAVYSLLNVKLEKVTFFGAELLNLTNSWVIGAAAAVIVYHLAYFVWLSIDDLMVWRIHLTGTRLRFLTGAKFAHEEADYPDDPRVSNLYWWWQSEAARIGNLASKADEIERCLREPQGVKASQRQKPSWPRWNLF